MGVVHLEAAMLSIFGNVHWRLGRLMRVLYTSSLGHHFHPPLSWITRR